MRLSHRRLTFVALALVSACEPRLPAGGAGVPRAGHVFIVTEENHDYADVIDSAGMPYLDSLAQQYGLATQYYANTHPSIGNYFMLGTGQIITNDDSYSTIVTVDNVVRRLLSAGKTWKSYAETFRPWATSAPTSAVMPASTTHSRCSPTWRTTPPSGSISSRSRSSRPT